MEEFPGDMNCDGKVSMFESCVRRACVEEGGEVDIKLHQHVREQTRAWCSDGADLSVPLAASAFFPGLTFISWDEAHSANRLLANSFVDDEEVTATELLLVTGKRPYSLAKFLTTSTVFRKITAMPRSNVKSRTSETSGGHLSVSTVVRNLTDVNVAVGTLSSRLSQPRRQEQTKIAEY